MLGNTSTLQIAIEVDAKDGIVSVRRIGDESEKAGKKGKKSFSGMGKSLDHFNKKAASATSSIMKLAGTVVSIYMLQRAIRALVNSMEKNIAAASRLNEVQSKFNVVFEGQRMEAEKWAKTLVDSYAMSRRESKEYLSSIQDLLVPMGMQAEMAGKLSFEIVKLSADLGSFNDLPTAQVMENIQSALVGEYEAMKKYGVVINATIVQEKALAMGLAETKDKLTAAHKAQAAYTLMVESSKAAIGDMARTSGEYANQLKQYKAIIEDVRVEFGEKLMPIATEALTKINKEIKELKETGQLDVWAIEMARVVIGSFQLMATGVQYVLESIYTARSIMASWMETWYKALSKYPFALKSINEGYKESARIWGEIKADNIKHMVNTHAAFEGLMSAIEKLKPAATKTLQDINKEGEPSLENFKKIERQINIIAADAFPGYSAAAKEHLTAVYEKLSDQEDKYKAIEKLIGRISGKELMETPDVEPDMTQTETYTNAMDQFRAAERTAWQEYYDWKKAKEKELWAHSLDYVVGYLGDITGIYKQIAGAGGKHSEEAFEIYKSFAKAQALIAGALGVMQVVGDMKIHPYVKAAFIALITGITSAQIAIIESSQPRGYKDGGIVQYGPGQPDDVPAWLTKGEFVVNDKATKKNRMLLEFINAEKYGLGGFVGGIGDMFTYPFQVLGNAIMPDMPGMSEVDLAGQMIEDLNETIRKLTSTLGDLARKVEDITIKYDEEAEKAKELGISIDLVTRARMAELNALAADISGDIQEIIESLTLGDYQQEMNRLTGWYDDQLEAIVALTAQGVDTTGMVEDLTLAYALQAEEAGKAAVELARQDLASAQDMQAMIRELAHPRSEWSVNDFVAEFDRLADQIGNLDDTSENYLSDLLSLTKDQVGILNHIEDLSRKTVESLKSSISSIDNMIVSLRGGELAPAQSMELFQSRYETLLAGAGTEQGLADFQSFIPEYLSFMQSYGVDYAELVGAVTADLEGIQTIFETQLTAVESLLGDISQNTEDTTMELVGLAAANNTLLSDMGASIGSLVDVLTTAAEAEAVAATEALAQAQAQAEAEAAAEAAQAAAAAAAEAAAIAAAEAAQAEAAAAAEAAAIAAAAAEEEARQNIISSIRGVLGLTVARDWFEFDYRQAIEGMMLSGLQDYLDNIIVQQQQFKGHQYGGLATELSWVAEKGPEWVVPTYEPERSRFLRDVGADPDVIGAAVARHIIPLVIEGGKEIHVHIEIDRREIGHAVAQEFDTNPEVVDAHRRQH